MTVQDLIEQLSEYPPKAEVAVYDNVSLREIMGTEQSDDNDDIVTLNLGRAIDL